ncbi:MAG TPA: hypothetical protein VHD35_11220 [Chitinophagaceae bacterium]|jgi:hypothetical protein|nr:hypothetical protein [Chitinophagaceae bacterium]
MKKQFIIFLLFSIHASAQNKDPNPHFPKVKITFPCTQEYINNYKGKWLIPGLDPRSFGVDEYHKEVAMRLNQIQNLVSKTYPQPIGNDAFWSGTLGQSSFADEVEYVLSDNEWKPKTLKTNPVYSYRYNVSLCSWVCHGTNEIMNGYPEIGGGGLVIKANDLEILNGNYHEGNEWRIDGRPIKKKMFTIGKWKGYDLMAAAGGISPDDASSHFILICRDGMLPIIPVTRKQYLERAIIYIKRTYDELTQRIIKSNEELPAQFRAPKEDIDRQKDNNERLKNDALKKLSVELDKTTKNGLLDSPAIIRIDPLFTVDGPIFLPEKDGGCLLATENPNYWRKDLPKYVPQFFMVELNWSSNLGWSKNFKNIIEEYFPIEQLKAMIDK